MSHDNQIAALKSEILFLHELIRDVVAGKIRIPKFQRPYVWRRDQMRDLLDSIRSQYPIGSLLLWEPGHEVASEEWIGPIQTKKTGQSDVAYVLDGQQRLSTLVGVLQASPSSTKNPSKSDPDRWIIWFNAKTKEFEHHKDNDHKEAWHCQLLSLLDTIQFLKECQRIISSNDPNAEQYVREMQTLSQTFNSYKMPVISLKNATLTQAVEIFSRLNSKGQRISADQMASALNYKESDGKSAFNLSEKIDNLIEILGGLNFGAINRNIVLRTFLAAMKEDVYIKDWSRLTDAKREQQPTLEQVIDEAGVALQDAALFLHTLGVNTTRLLPYAMQLVALAAFFLKCKTPTLEQKNFLRRWFWVSSFTCRFATSNPSQDNQLVIELRDVVSQNPNPSTLENMRFDTPAEPFPLSFDMRSARARTFLLVLLAQEPQDEEGKVIAQPWQQLEKDGPNSIGRIFQTVEDKELASSPANRILQINNLGQANNWLQKLENKAPDLRAKILASHAIPEDAFEDLLKENKIEFLRKRRDHLIALEREFMQREGITLPVGRDVQAAPIDTE